jgi:hypothetical protein
MVFIKGFWLSKVEAAAFKKARLVQDWNTPDENSEAVAALVRMTLAKF